MIVTEVNIKLLNKLAKIPTRGSVEAAGMDLYAASDEEICIPAHQTVKVDTGISLEIPKGYFGGIYARSGLATKRSLRPANCIGVIDSDYRGPVIVALHNDSDETQYIDPQERIAQLIIQPYLNIEFNVVDNLDDTDRGSAGFGSTGEK